MRATSHDLLLVAVSLSDELELDLLMTTSTSGELDLDFLIAASLSDELELDLLLMPASLSGELELDLELFFSDVGSGETLLLGDGDLVNKRKKLHYLMSFLLILTSMSFRAVNKSFNKSKQNYDFLTK